MSASPLVSIALCTYNGQQYLAEQLRTIFDQTYTNLEIVVADDNSTDGTRALLTEFAAIEPRLKLHFNPQNLGYVKNFEKVISLCSGDYIALADQDDIWLGEKIDLLVNNIGNAALIYHDSTFINDQNEVIGRMSGIMNMYEGSSPLPFLFYNCVSGHSCMFTRALIPHLGEFDPRFYHDLWIAFVAANKGGIKYVNKPLVKYRQHQSANTDILQLKAKNIRHTHKFAELNILWLNHCLKVTGKYNKLIARIIYLYENAGPLNQLRLICLLLDHFNELYFIKKKGIFNKLNYVRKMVYFNRRESYTINAK